MKLGVLLSCAFAASALALPAVAQEATRGRATVMTAPTLSETKSGQAEWYRQFARPQPADTKPAWLSAPEEEFSVTFGADRRWQLSLDKLSRPSDSPLPREEMQAGAIFRVSPRFSVGGEVSVGGEELNSASKWESSEMEAGIRLKSAFKF